MNTYFSEIEFRTGPALVSRALVAVLSREHEAASILAIYARANGLVILDEPEFADAISLKRDRQFTHLHAHIMQKAVVESPVQFLVLNEAPAQQCDFALKEFDESLPVFLVFNVPRNIVQFRRLRSEFRKFSVLAGYSDDSFAELPATVGVRFPSWTDEAQEMAEGLDAPLILSNPPDALAYENDLPAFVLMAQDTWSISHPLDCYWWRSAPVIDAEPPDLAGTRMFRLLRPKNMKPHLGYIGRAMFDFRPLSYDEIRIDDPSCPGARILKLACETAIAQCYLSGVDFSALPPSMRRQAAAPDLTGLGDVKAALDKIQPSLEAAILQYYKLSHNRIDYQTIRLLAASFGLAAENNQLETAVQHWNTLCTMDSAGLPYSMPARQILGAFVIENCR